MQDSGNASGECDERAYLAAQWNQEPQSDPWAEDVIAKFRQTSELGYGGNHDK